MCTARRAAVTGILLFALGCAPTYHRASALRYDASAAAALEAEAARECRERLAELPGPPPLPTQPFRSDGCSMWPDGSFVGEVWQRCCIDHDVAYWCGGSAEMREQADAELRDCVARQSPWMGAVMECGVRVGGAPWVPAYWRWGYGHPYPAGYFEPTP